MRRPTPASGCARPSAADRGTSVKIATYNINGINGRLPQLTRWLAEAEPDVVCLQEIKSPDDKFPRVALEDAGYGALWIGEKSYNGVAILSKCMPSGMRPPVLAWFFPLRHILCSAA